MGDALHDQARKVGTGGGAYAERGDVLSTQQIGVLLQRGDLDQELAEQVLLKLWERVAALEAHAAALGAEVAHWKAVALAHDHYWRDLAADVRGNGRAGLKERVRLALRLLAVLIVALTGLAVGVLLIARHVGL